VRVQRPEVPGSDKLLGQLLMKVLTATCLVPSLCHSLDACVCLFCLLQVRVQCPEVPGSDKLLGQLLEVEMASLRDSVGHLKSRLEGVTGVAVNKQKLNREGVGFLRDEFSLAHYNIGPDVVLVLGSKERGGKKK
jgi:hypothetical protein